MLVAFRHSALSRSHRALLTVAVVLLVAPLLTGPAAGQEPSDLDAALPLDLEAIGAEDDAQLHGTVTPPGTDPRNATAEVEAYDSLVQTYDDPDLDLDTLLTDHFEHRRFGPVEDPQRTYQPREGVVVQRTGQWGRPVIVGATDEDMAFGAGYVTAEDRLPILELLRAAGRAELFQLLETNEAWLADARLARLYGYGEDELQAMIDRLPEVYGQDGQDIVDALDEYVAGINAYLAEAARGDVPLPTGLSDLGIEAPAPYSTTDVVAATGFVRSLFGANGGAGLRNAEVLAGLIADVGEGEAQTIYDDFRLRTNEDGPVHTQGSFPYHLPDQERIDPEANVFGFDRTQQQLDDRLAGLFGAAPATAAQRQDALTTLAGQFGELADQAEAVTGVLHDGIDTLLGRLQLPDGGMSNYLIVDGQTSASGHPILLGGPQTGYFSPGLVMDYELHSPTISARGAGFPGLSAVVIFGRTSDYAWTPTAGGGDNIDLYAVQLCEPDGSEPTTSSYHYVHDDECVEMERRVIRTVDDSFPVELPGSDQLPDVEAERTVHGQVIARGEVGELPVAVAKRRSTFGKELDAAVSILRMNRGEAATGEDFVDIFHESHNLNTNWGYVNADEIAHVHGGLYPKRPAEVHPDFAVWGDGRWEWETDDEGNTRYIDRDERPHEVAPERGFLHSWNNRVAADWGAADDNWVSGSVERADLLDRPLAEVARRAREDGEGVTPLELTRIMQQAGLTDLRGSDVLPVILRVLEAGDAEAPSDREAEMVAVLEEWIEAGALRRDSEDGSELGSYDHTSAVAIMDAFWEPATRAVFDPVLGDVSRMPPPFNDPPDVLGSAWNSGTYSHVRTDLGTLLGDELASPFGRTYCGGAVDEAGDLDVCAQRLWDALAEAGDALAEAQQTDDPREWSATEQADRIRFLPAAALSMHWNNRPTTQQLAMFGATADEEEPGPPEDPGPPDEPGPPDDEPPRAQPEAPLPATGPGSGVGVGMLLATLALGLAGLLHRPGVTHPSAAASASDRRRHLLGPG